MTRRLVTTCSALVVWWMFFVACGEPSLQFVPPLLIDTAGLEDSVDFDSEPLVFGQIRNADFPDQKAFGGHVFGVGGPAIVNVAVDANQADAYAAIAVYGPRMKNGLFGRALAHHTGPKGGRSLIWNLELPGDGDYLILVADAGHTGGGYILQLDCSEGCEPPACEPLACGPYCAAGLAQDIEGCSLCACASACQMDADCPLGFNCMDNTCLRTSDCPCNDPYDPVCGTDGLTYANLCELDCKQVALDHSGECQDRPECSSDSDCPAGMLCENGLCASACDCSGWGYNPVCGTNGVTYLNDCERQCAQVGLAHQGVCEECNPEVCDGVDNDCDGQVDEGVCNTCQTDSDCPAGSFCWAGTCVGEMACTSNADCPAGQICMNGICQPEEGCEPEVCDGVDNDCDGQTDEGCPACRSDADCAAGEICHVDTGLCGPPCADDDNDGFDSCEGDCDDADASVHPGAEEICDDNKDNDCDGQIDDGCTGTPCSSDSDCAAGLVCESGLCVNPACTDNDNDGFCDDQDCDDSDATVYPGAEELCDDQDNDCDTLIDEDFDLMSDRFNCGECSLQCAAGQICVQGACIVEQPCATNDDCDDGNPATTDACINGTCIHTQACQSNPDCEVGQMCHNGVCLGSGPCSTDIECPQDWLCVTGACALPCRDDSDCEAYQYCTGVGEYCAP